MTGRERTLAALSGAHCIAFAPLAWARLPDFVRAQADTEFWLDVGATQRMLSDAGGVCAADALTVPLLPQPFASATQVPYRAEAMLSHPGTAAAIELLRRLAAVGTVGLIAELPGLSQLTALLPGAAVEDVEDALSDLGRAGLEAGAYATVIRSSQAADVALSVSTLAPLADFYGAPVLGTDGERGWAAHAKCPVELLKRDGTWPAIAHGIILTGGDVTEWWTPDDMRTLLCSRGGAV